MWDGSLVTKSIGSVKFVPLTEMTARDWEWLDYDNIRTVAKNRIAGMIVRGELLGFFQVLIKAHKDEYFWPANKTMVQRQTRVRAAGGDEKADFFRYSKEVTGATVDVAHVERLRRSITLYSSLVLLAFITALAMFIDTLIPSDDNLEKQQQLESVDLAQLEEMRETDKDLFVSVLAMWVFDEDESIAVMEDLPNEDDAEQMLEYIKDVLANLSFSRGSIAAVRGTKHIFG